MANFRQIDLFIRIFPIFDYERQSWYFSSFLNPILFHLPFLRFLIINIIWDSFITDLAFQPICSVKHILKLMAGDIREIIFIFALPLGQEVLIHHPLLFEAPFSSLIQKCSFREHSWQLLIVHPTFSKIIWVRMVLPSSRRIRSCASSFL